MSVDYWLNRRKAIEIKKIKKYITLPSFSVNCGFTRGSLCLFGSDDDAPVVAASLHELKTGFSFSAWVYFEASSSSGAYSTIFSRLEDSGSSPQVWIYIRNGVLHVNVLKGAASIDHAFSKIIPQYSWAHIGIRWDGTTLYAYINGEKDTTSHSLAANLDSITTPVHYIGYSPHGVGLGYIGKICNISIWQTAIDEEWFYSIGRFAFRAIDSLTWVDDALVYHYRLNEGTGNDITDVFNDETGSGTLLTWSTDSPVKFGASFVCAEFTVTASAECSLIFPVVPPSDVNFGLVVRWTENGVTERRTLFTVAGVDINPFPPTYNGEDLPTSFVLEVWNIDGEDDATLSEDITLYLSILTDPTTSYDQTSIADATITINSALAENFPLTNFPLEFNTQQTY